MNFIKKVFQGGGDELVHLQFQKFSKGEFRNRALIKAKRAGGKYTLVTSAEFANELVRIMAEKLGQEKAKITGAIISTNDLKNEIKFKEIKQFQGVKKYILDTEMSGKEILQLLEKLPRAFFALSFSCNSEVLKIKPKAPKSGKPGSKEEAPVADFCRLVTIDKEIADSFIFENPNFKNAVINHTFIITEIIIPEELRESKDFALIRERAKRKGIIVRNAVIDEQILKEEKEFIA